MIIPTLLISESIFNDAYKRNSSFDKCENFTCSFSQNQVWSLLQGTLYGMQKLNPKYINPIPLAWVQICTQPPISYDFSWKYFDMELEKIWLLVFIFKKKFYQVFGIF